MSPHGRNAKSILVTGCDSGVGLEVVKALAAQSQGHSNLAVILAAAKNPNNSELAQLARNNPKVKALQLDLEDQKSFGNFANEVQKRLNDAGVQHLSALINSAALHFNASLNNVDAGHMIKAFSVNAVSPLMLIKALSKQLENGARVAGSSANVGSGADAMLYATNKASNVMGGPSDALNAGAHGVHGGMGAGAAGMGASAGAGMGAGTHGVHGGMGAGAAGMGSGAAGMGAGAAGMGAGAAGMGSGAAGMGSGAAGMGAGAAGVGANLAAGMAVGAGAAGANLSANAHFGVGGVNSGAILVGASGLAFNGNGGGLVVNLTTGLSSIGANNSGKFYAYRASKAALNMITKSAAADLASSGVLVFSLNIDNAALDSLNASAGANAGNNANGAQGFNAMSVANAINNLVNNGNATLNGSLINVQGAPLLV